jgi:hypothetical protein
LALGLFAAVGELAAKLDFLLGSEERIAPDLGQIAGLDVVEGSERPSS